MNFYAWSSRHFGLNIILNIQRTAAIVINIRTKIDRSIEAGSATSLVFILVVTYMYVYTFVQMYAHRIVGSCNRIYKMRNAFMCVNIFSSFIWIYIQSRHYSIVVAINTYMPTSVYIVSPTTLPCNSSTHHTPLYFFTLLLF